MVKAENYVCLPNEIITIEINPSEIKYFQTPEFPKILDSSFSCEMNLTFPEANKNSKILFVITNVAVLPQPYTLFYLLASPYNPNINNFYLFSSADQGGLIQANPTIQGFLFFDEWNNNDCVLQSISRMKPYKFLDETQILYIKSSYFLPLLISDRNDYTRKRPCKWLFEAPKEYGFKIYIEYLNLLTDVKLLGQNSTNFKIIGSNSKPNHAYYNRDNHLNIFLSKSALNVSTDAYEIQEFTAFISIVKKKIEIIVDANCILNYTQNSIIGYRTIFSTNGYPNNAECIYNLIIEYNTEVLLQVQQLSLEKNVDLLTYEDGLGNEIILNSGDKIVFEGYKDRTTQQQQQPKNYTIKFQSDGSIQKEGFIVWFNKIFCSCAHPIFTAPCNESINYFITNTTDIFGNYCGNMKCNFTIKSDPKCSTKLIRVTINVHNNNQTFFDIFKIISNNITILNMNNNGLNSGEQVCILEPSANNIFQAITFSSKIKGDITITLSTFEANDKKVIITLNESIPFYALEIVNFDINDFFIVQVNSNSPNALIEIVSSVNPYQIPSIQLYNNKSLTYRIENNNCFFSSDLSGWYCKTQQKEIAVFILSNSKPILLFQLPKEFRKGCIFEDNAVLLTSFSNDDISFSAIANKMEYCRIFILIDTTSYTLPTVLQNIWTTTAKENLKIFSGTEKRKLIFDLNFSTSSQWNYIMLWSNFFILELPSNSSLLIHLCIQNPCKFPDASIYNVTKPYTSILTTPFYGENKNSLSYKYRPDRVCEIWNKYIWIEYNMHVDEIRFTVIQYNISNNFNFNITFNNVLQNISKVGDTLKFPRILHVKICYEPTKKFEDIPIDDYSGIVIYIDVHHKNELYSNQFISNSNLP